MTQRKPPVVAIRGTYQRDRITQAELLELSELQAAEWTANRATQRTVSEIETRIAHGAIVEPGALEFDADLKMARRGKVKVG